MSYHKVFKIFIETLQFVLAVILTKLYYLYVKESRNEKNTIRLFIFQ
jgi:hypothetical protein